MGIVKGDKVKHSLYGEGVVAEVYLDYASVNFFSVGIKSILFSALSAVEKEAPKMIQITKREIVNSSVEILSAKRKALCSVEDIIELLSKKLSLKITTEIINESLSPNNGKIALSILIGLSRKLRFRIIQNIVFDVEKYGPVSQAVIVQNQLPPTINDFEKICSKVKFNSTVKLFMARAIIDYAKKYYFESNRTYTFHIYDLSSYILDAFLYQISVGHFFNDSLFRQPDFYKLLIDGSKEEGFIQNNKNDLTLCVQKYLINHFLKQFLIIDKLHAVEIYKIDESQNLVFSGDFLEGIKSNADNFDKKIISRIGYFLPKINPNNERIKAYVSNLSKGLDKKKYISNFQYDDNLNQMKKTLIRDYYTKNEFKEIMKQFNIPANNTYLSMCLDRLDYTQRTKRIILKSKYPSLIAYFRETICADDIYRYKNPLNLDELDGAIRTLCNELKLIDLGEGVYLTRKNMAKNGVNDSTINKFHTKVLNYGRKMRFFSLKDFCIEEQNDIVVDYCHNDLRQLIQFIKPINGINILEIGKGGVILSFSFATSKRKGEFIQYIMSGKESMNIYEIHNYVLDVFDIEYPFDEIVKDVAQTDFYYSEELETAYRNKETFIKEVYYGRN